MSVLDVLVGAQERSNQRLYDDVNNAIKPWVQMVEQRALHAAGKDLLADLESGKDITAKDLMKLQQKYALSKDSLNDMFALMQQSGALENARLQRDLYKQQTENAKTEGDLKKGELKDQPNKQKREAAESASGIQYQGILGKSSMMNSNANMINALTNREQARATISAGKNGWKLDVSNGQIITMDPQGNIRTKNIPMTVKDRLAAIQNDPRFLADPTAETAEKIGAEIDNMENPSETHLMVGKDGRMGFSFNGQFMPLPGTPQAPAPGRPQGAAPAPAASPMAKPQPFVPWDQRFGNAISNFADAMNPTPQKMIVQRMKTMPGNTWEAEAQRLKNSGLDDYTINKYIGDAQQMMNVGTVRQPSVPSNNLFGPMLTR
jgi:hypothetical protein